MPSSQVVDKVEESKEKCYEACQDHLIRIACNRFQLNFLCNCFSSFGAKVSEIVAVSSCLSWTGSTRRTGSASSDEMVIVIEEDISTRPSSKKFFVVAPV